MQRSHVKTEPAILYFGTPVVLISTTNEDGSANIAPMSSAFWLGWRCMLGLESSSKTTENMLRTGECVLNLASVDEAEAVNRLARLTGSNPVPPSKLDRGYTYEKNKFEIAGLTQLASETVNVSRAQECAVHMEAVVADRRPIMEDLDAWRGFIQVFEVRITRVHIDPALLLNGKPNRVNSDKWMPLMMSFSKLYSLSPSQVLHSALGEIDEAKYRSPDVDRANG
jgi:flavin reductase (DIM6/NTAB) family NADH-FMN oxidoreductase RutF